MTMLIASLMFIGLFSISLAHMTWSVGATWPIRDPKLLAQTVVGTAGVERMPPRLALFGVGVVTFAAGVAALALADPEGGGEMLTIAGFGLALLFLARGLVGYTAWWARETPEPIFRLYDRRVYAPLCLFIGAGFLVLGLARLL